MSPLMDLADAGAYLRFKGSTRAGLRSATLRWCRRHDVRMEKRGRSWLVRQAAIDVALAKSATGDTLTRARAWRADVSDRVAGTRPSRPAPVTRPSVGASASSVAPSLPTVSATQGGH